jgi:hypothetical protein
MPTLTEFSNTPPGNNTLNFYYENISSSLEIQAINVSTRDCSNRIIYDELAEITKIGFNYNSTEYVATISESTYKSGPTPYYHYTVEPFPIPTGGLSELATGLCINTTLSPGPGPANFSNSNYNAAFSNATSSRASGYLYDVDRVGDQITPTNINNIISESATLAQVPDSYYTSEGILNSRYRGSETSKQEYGIEPVFGPTLIQAEVYELDKNPLIYASASNSTILDICSKSLADREFVDILFAPSILDLSGSNQQLATAPDERFIDTAIGKTRVYPGWNLTQTTITFHGYGPLQLLTGSFDGFALDLEVGDIFTTRYSLYAERMKVTSVSLEVGPSGGPLPNITASYGVVRNYYGNRDQLALLTGATAYTPVLVTDVISVRKLVGDTILRADTTKAEKLTDKKLFIEKTNTILYVNDEGRVIWNVHTCI